VIGPTDARGENGQPGMREAGPAECPLCQSTELLVVSLRLLDGDVSFTHCNRCEWRTWERAGRQMPLGAVLRKVPPRRRTRRG
jgi:hypothetical protein